MASRGTLVPPFPIMMQRALDRTRLADPRLDIHTGDVRELIASQRAGAPSSCVSMAYDMDG